MERDANDLTGATSGARGAASASEGTGAAGGTETGGIADRAREVAGAARDRLADVGHNVRDQTGAAKDKLADLLETGAGKLRQRRGEMAGATGTSDVSVSADDRMTQVNDRVAGGMQATADWLREADFDHLRAGVERQVKEHPGRTLLIALGLGYLLGKALRR